MSSQLSRADVQLLLDYGRSGERTPYLRGANLSEQDLDELDLRELAPRELARRQPAARASASPISGMPRCVTLICAARCSWERASTA